MLTKREARRIKSVIEAKLREGLAPPGQGSHGEISAVGAAAAEIGVQRMTLINRVRDGGPCAQLGFPVDWSLYRPRVVDAVAERAKTDDAAATSRRIAELERRAIAALEHRKSILGLTAAPLRPSILPGAEAAKGRARHRRPSLRRAPRRTGFVGGDGRRQRL